MKKCTDFPKFSRKANTWTENTYFCHLIYNMALETRTRRAHRGQTGKFPYPVPAADDFQNLM